MTPDITSMRVLFVDCQATAAHPSGRLLEVGWSTGARSPGTSFLLRSKSDPPIPKGVQRITGIEARDLEQGSSESRVWSALERAAREVSSSNQGSSCPTVIHFARFEEPFLRKLAREQSAQDVFPFQIACTHAMAKRLLPELPRRGLRALAGYYGHSVPELRRSDYHVAATEVVWTALVDMLVQREGIRSWSDLLGWLDEKPIGPSSVKRFYPLESRLRRELPDAPGVYRMQRSNGDVLYVGKASSLKRRVNSYFQKKSHHGQHILEMLTQARDLKVTVTGSALEAALLECDEIKRLSPPYNIALRDRREPLTFSSPDFRSLSERPDEVHRLGPLRWRESVTPLARWALFLRETRLPERRPEDRAELVWSRSEPPELSVLKEGGELFRSRHASLLDSARAPWSLVRLGSALWRATQERDARQDNEDREETEDEEPQATASELWTAERVASSLERLVLHATHGIRRARWLCLTSEMSLAWESSPGRKVLLVLASGKVREREELSLDAAIPPPPLHFRTRRERQESFDRSIYDRLSVITGELKRMIRAGRGVEVRLGPRLLLKNAQLARIMEWV